LAFAILPGDRVTFADGVQGTLTLTSGGLEVTGGATIVGPGADLLTISGNHAWRAVTVDAAATLTLSGLTITAGLDAIDNYGTLTVSNCSLSGNSQLGGISNYSGGTATVTGSTFASNSGWAIGNTGTLTVTDCLIESNTSNSGSGGISILGGAVMVSGSTFRNNRSLDSFEGGGALYSGATTGTTTVTVTNCTFESNSAQNNGGAIMEQFVGSVTVIGCTFHANSAASGGAVVGIVKLIDCTLTSNSASVQGGGFYALYASIVTDCTLSGNSAPTGGGISYYTATGSGVLLENTIVAGNHGGSGPDISGLVLDSSAYNLVGIDDGSLSGLTDGVNGNQVGSPGSPIDPLLGPLGDHGGPTQTMPLLAGSPALNAGDPDRAGMADQRGVVRSDRVNIGAFQASAASLLITAPDTVTAGVPFDFTVAAVDIYGNVDISYVGTFHLGILPEFPDLADAVFTSADHGSVRFVGIELYQAGTDTILAEGDLSGQAGITVNPGAAVGFVLLAPANAVSGTPFDVTVIAVDAYGNIATNYTGTISFSSSDSDPGVVLPPEYTFQAGDNGMVTFSGGVTLITPGDQTLTVTDLDSGITGSTIVTL
jgi:hypothetical protein